tara:strand:- start:209 stop:925 length:717 start_codon:yes stop_codon:yes gene_type:complete
MINNRKIYAIIPARGGSKGIPKKNIKNFNGKPLISYSIEYANFSKYIDNIIISTDCPEIKKIAQNFTSNKKLYQIIDRPLELATDEATTESAIEHVINECKINEQSIIILLQPTSPVRPAHSLDSILKKFIEQEYDSLLTLSPIHPLTWKINKNKPECMYDYKNRPRRQDFNQKDFIYDENGSVYIFTSKLFKKNKNRLGGKIGYFIFKEEYGKQIDTPLDFEILESIEKYLKRNKNE